MKFAFDEFHLWYQLALSMVACGKVRVKARVPERARFPRQQIELSRWSAHSHRQILWSPHSTVWPQGCTWWELANSDPVQGLHSYLISG